MHVLSNPDQYIRPRNNPSSNVSALSKPAASTFTSPPTFSQPNSVFTPSSQFLTATPANNPYFGINKDTTNNAANSGPVNSIPNSANTAPVNFGPTQNPVPRYVIENIFN